MTEPWPFRTAVVVALAALATPGSRPARADDAATARKDFRTGLSLLRQGESVAACRMFERSYLEEAAPGTLYNLSLCREQEGRLDDAYRGFVELADVADEAHDPAKAEAVRAKATALRARLARLDLSRRDDVPAAITGLSIDETVLANDAWRSPLYVLPGKHQLSIKHDDGVTVTRVTAALRAGESEALVIDEPSEVPRSAPLAPVTVAPVPPPPPRKRTAAYVAGGAAVALLAAGAVFGALAVVRKNDADDACNAATSPTGTTCASNGAAATATHEQNIAHTESTLSTIGLAAGASAAAVAVVLLLVGGSSSSTAATGTRGLTPTLVAGPHAGGLGLTGRF